MARWGKRCHFSKRDLLPAHPRRSLLCPWITIQSSIGRRIKWRSDDTPSVPVYRHDENIKNRRCQGSIQRPINALCFNELSNPSVFDFKAYRAFSWDFLINQGEGFGDSYSITLKLILFYRDLNVVDIPANRIHIHERVAAEQEPKPELRRV